MDYSFQDRETGRRHPIIPHIDVFLAGHAQARNLATPPPPPPSQQQQQPQTTTTPPSARALICASRVAHTPELAEHILQHLSARQLVSATRVNQFFRDLILTSPSLSRTTFMRPPNPDTPTKHCQFVQWGPGLHQRHLAPLPQPSFANDTPILAVANPMHQAFHSMTLLYHHAVQMSLLCPLLKPAQSSGTNATNVPPFALLPSGATAPVRTTARFSEKLLLVPASPRAKLQISGHDGVAAAAAPPSTFTSATTSSTDNPWTSMQLSTPPTRHADISLSWEGRLNGELRVTVEATRTMHRSEHQRGITLQSLLHHASSSPGPVTISETMPSGCQVFQIAQAIQLWGSRTRENSSLAGCIDEMVRTEPGRRFVWTVGARSEVTIDGVVVPTEGELEMLAESGHLSSTPAPLVFHFVEPGAGEEGGEEQQGEDDADDDADDEE